MRAKMIAVVLGIGLVSVLVLGGCSGRQQPATNVPTELAAVVSTATKPAATRTATATAAIRPSPTYTAELPPQPTVDETALAYPGPDSGAAPPEQPTSVYPAPGVEAPVESATPVEPYPDPGAESPLLPPTSTAGNQPTQIATAAATQTRVVPPTATPTLTSPRPTVDPQLRATDPNTVKLASGKVQLIEFFAFW